MRVRITSLICILGSVVSAAAESEAAPSRDGPEDRLTDPSDEGCLPIMDFSEGAEGWRSVDDVVMGGISASEFVVSKGMAVFRGNVSLENNGGFASAQSKPCPYDLSDFDGLRIRVRGDGKRYAFRVRTTSCFDGISYQARFDTRAGEWIEILLPFDGFRPVFRGREVPRADPLDPCRIQTFGLLISDKQEGPFLLELDRIMAYKKDARD